MPRQFHQRLGAWLDNNRRGVILLSIAVVIACGALAVRLQIRSDLTNLLPSGQKSVQDLNAIRARAQAFGTIQVVLEGSAPPQVAKASAELVKELATLPSHLVAQVSTDDGPRDRYIWAHRFLFADLADLTAARDGLAEKINSAKIAANPLFIDLDDEPKPPVDPKAATEQLDKLEAKLTELEAKATNPPPRVTADGTLRLVTIQARFSASDTGSATELMHLVEAAIGRTHAAVPGVTIDLTGNITLGLHEHDSVLEGMTLSLVITLVLVGLGLTLYYRSILLVGAMLWSLAVGVMMTFAIAWAAIGHLNVMTAFLFAIVIGNGVNAGLILVARFLEELREVDDARAAVITAMREAVPGTLAAAATAAVAYASLVVTDFRGFRQFGAIGGLGMITTWITTFTVLPATLFLLARRGLIKRTRPPRIGEMLARFHPKSDRRAIVVFAIITAIATAISTVYIARDPFTRDWRDLQSSTPAIDKAMGLYMKMRKLPSSGELTGQAYQIAFAVENRDDAATLVAYLRTADKHLPEDQRWIRDVFSVTDILPQQQEEKLAVLADIRRLLDDPGLRGELSPADVARLDKLRPPEDLRVVTDKDIPTELAWPFTERDGTIGKLVLLRGATRLDSFNVDHRREFAKRARALALPVPAIAAAESLIVADIIETMEADAPLMVIFAILGSAIAVFIVLGVRRHGLVTLGCGLAGVVTMIAACAVAGLPVHFLDLIALPITVGIGIDYAVNIAARDRLDGAKGPEYLLKTVGGTVLMCSYTTSVGYGTLLLSANGGIKAFGLAALLGEVACVGIALVATPALLAVLRRRDPSGNPAS